MAGLVKTMHYSKYWSMLFFPSNKPIVIMET
jgi:hypothetical protein